MNDELKIDLTPDISPDTDESLGTGLIPQPTDSRDALYGAFEVLGAFPDEYELPRLSFYRNQGKQNSCVAQAVARIMDYANALENDSSKVSAQYGFAYCKAEDGQPTLQGTFFKTGLDVGTKTGFSKTWEDNPNQDYITYIRKPSEAADASAPPFRFAGYVQLSTPEQIKDYITKYKLPVMTGINSNNTGWSNTVVKNNNFTLKEPTGDRVGHAVVIVGWNDKGWIIENSWGSTWADTARATVPYDYSGLQSYGYATYDLPNGWQTQNQDYQTKYFPQARAIAYWMYKTLLLREPESTQVLDAHAAFLAKALLDGNEEAVKQFYQGFKKEIKIKAVNY